MITDDPGTPGAGRWEINIAATGRHGAFGSEKELPLLNINYGLRERMQLKYQLPWVWLHDDAGRSRSGIGNSLLGMKVRFCETGETGWQVSTDPQLALRNSGSTSVRRGLAEDGTSLFIPFEFQRAFESFSANFEMGREFRSRDTDVWAGGIVIGQQ